MTNISITDATSAQFNLSLATPISFGLQPASAIRFAQDNVVALLDKTIDEAELKSLTLGFTYTPSFTLDGGCELALGGSLASSFTIFRCAQAKPGEVAPALFPEDIFGDDPLSLIDTCYTMLQCQAGLSVNGTEKLSPFVVSAGTKDSASAAVYLRYPKVSSYPTLKQALMDAFSSYSVSVNRAQLTALPPGRLFTYEVSGSISGSGKFNLLAAVNPTVSCGVTELPGLLSVQASPELTIGGSLTLTSDFQIRARRIDADTLRIGHFRKKGSTLAVTYDAGAGVSATAGGFDLIAPIFKLLGSGAGISKEWFEQRGAQEQAKDIQDALSKAIQQKLSIAIDGESDATASDSTAFLFDFHLPSLDVSGERALDALIAGDLSSLISSETPPVGVIKHYSILDRVRSTTHSLSVNFLGILSYADVAKFALDSTTKYTENGEVAMMDKATASDIQVSDAPLMKAKQLRHVLSDLFTATASYQCSSGTAGPDFTVTQQFYDYESKIDAGTLSWFEDVARQFSKPQSLPSGPYGGPAWIHLLSTYKKKEAMLLFLDTAGYARAEAVFLSIGRRAMVAASECFAPANFLSHMREEEPYWNAVVGKDPGTFVWQMNDTQKTQFQMACFAVSDWASAMAKLAKTLEQMVSYTAAHDPATLAKDATFLDLRTQLANELKGATTKTVGSWVPSWSSFAIDLCQPPTTGQISMGFLRKTYAATLP